MILFVISLVLFSGYRNFIMKCMMEEDYPNYLLIIPQTSRLLDKYESMHERHTVKSFNPVTTHIEERSQRMMCSLVHNVGRCGCKILWFGKNKRDGNKANLLGKKSNICMSNDTWSKYIQ